MCYITATELKNNLKKYLELSSKEDVYVTKNGKVITVLTSPEAKATDDFLSLRDEIKKQIDPQTKIDCDNALYEEIKKRCGF